MKRLIFIILFMVSIQGCSTMGILDAVNPFKEDKGIEVSAQIGKNNTQVKTDNKSLVSSNDKVDVTNTTTSDNKANVINQAVITTADKSTISTKNTSTVTNDNKADVINQDTSTITNYPTPVWLILAFAGMAGIAIPNPFNYFSDRRKRIERKESREGLLSEIKNLREQLNGQAKEDTKTNERSMAEDSKLSTDLGGPIANTRESDRIGRPK